MTEQHSTYQHLLKGILEQRCAKNPKYSLRAMASQLKLSPATLSSVLSGKKNLSLQRARQVAKALSLKKKESERFLLQVQVSTTKDEEVKLGLLRKLKSLGALSQAKDLSLDHFRIVSDWHHYAILSLTELANFEFNKSAMSAVAKKLGISRVEVEQAIARLEKLQMIECVNGRYQATAENFNAQSVAPSLALRTYHKQLLQKAVTSVERQTPNKKYIGSETLAIDSSKLPEFAEITEEYFSKVLRLAKESDSKDHVYHLGIQFFRSTTKD